MCLCEAKCAKGRTSLRHTTSVHRDVCQCHDRIPDTRRIGGNCMLPRILRMRQTTQAPRILVGIRVEDIVQHASFVRPVAQYVTGDRMSSEGRANLDDDRTVLPRTDQFGVKSIASSNQRLALRKIKHLVQLHLVDFSPRPFMETRTEDACDVNGLHLINPLMHLGMMIISNPSHLPQTNVALSYNRIFIFAQRHLPEPPRKAYNVVRWRIALQDGSIGSRF